MTNSRSIHTLTIALIILASAGCGGGTGASGVPSAAEATRFAGAAATVSVGGQFAGSVQDSVFGKGRIFADLSQYQNSVGGVMTFEYGSTVFIVPTTFLLDGRTLTGSGAIGKVINGGGVCPASETATYTSSHNLNGSYKVTSGCLGDNGTFSMQQQCRYSPGSAAEINFGLKRCD